MTYVYTEKVGGSLKYGGDTFESFEAFEDFIHEKRYCLLAWDVHNY